MKQWERQHVTSNAKPKVQYLTHYAASKVVPRLHNGYKYDIYICEICSYYHIGRHSKKGNSYYEIVIGRSLYDKRINEVLAGRLVKSLRLVLDKK